MSCLQYNQEKFAKKTSKGILLPPSDRLKLITSIAADNRDVFMDLIQVHDVRLSVYKDETGLYTVTPSSANKLSDMIQITDDYTQILEVGTNKSFTTEEQKSHSKIAITATVNALLESIPFVREIPRSVAIGRQSYTYFEHLPVTKTRQLLYSIYNPNGYSPSVESLERILRNKLESNTLDTEDHRILLSIYNYVYSPADLEYRDAMGNTTLLKSLANVAEQSQSQDIRERARNFMKIFHIAIVAVNDFSKLVIVTEDGNVSRSTDNTTMFRMESVNAPIINNLFEPLDIVDGSDDSEIVEVKIKDEVAHSFINNDIGVIEIFDKDGKPKQYASFVYTDSKTGQKYPVNIPVLLTKNKESLIDVRNIYAEKVADFTQKNITEGGLNDEDAAKKAILDADSLLKNPDLILFILDKIGYSGVINRNTLNYILKSPLTDAKDNTNKIAQNLDKLWTTIATGIVSVSANLDQARRDKKVDYKHYFINTNTSFAAELLSNIRQAFKYISVTNDPNNNNKAFQASSLVEEGIDIKEFDSSVISPTSFWKTTQWVASQIMAASGIYRKSSQRNGDNENVDVNNIATPAENIKRKVVAAKALGNNTSLKNNHFVKEGVAIIEGVERLDSYKKKRTEKGKSHMSMNSTEIHRMINQAYINNLVDNFDYENRTAPTALVTPKIYSDKSFWGGFRVRYNQHNFFPIKENKIDVNYLLNAEVLNTRQQDMDFSLNFINEWNNMYKVDPVTGEKTDLILRKIPTEILTKGNSEQFTTWLNSIEIYVPANTPISGVENKYYNLSTKGDMWKLTIAPILRDKLLRVYASDSELQLQILSQLALDHNNIIKNGSSLSAKNRNNERLNKKIKSAIDDKSLNINLELGEGSVFDLSEIMTLNEDGVVRPDSIGRLPIRTDLDDQQIQNLVEKFKDMHPIEVAMFFSHQMTVNHVNDLLIGSTYQYKNGSEDAMMVDMLKRAVGAASGGVPLSLDSSKVPVKEDLRLPEFSNVLHVREFEVDASLLGTGTQESVDPYDGSSRTTSLTEALIQASAGGIDGMMPNSSIKFFYSNVDLRNGDQNLLKYALHVVTEELLNMGSKRAWEDFKLQLGTMSLGREVVLPDVTYEGEVIVPGRTFSANESMFTIYLHIKTEKDKVIKSFSTDRVMLDLLRENPDLKNRFVHQLVGPSSQKTGKSMYHTREVLVSRVLTGDTLNDYEFIKIDNKSTVIQLDATHDPENGKISKFSQAYTNAVQEGRTFELADQLLNTLAELSGLNREIVREQFSEGKFDFDEEFDINSFKLENIHEFKDIYIQGLPKKREDDLLIQRFNSDALTPKRRTHLFIRSTVMGTMEQQKNFNATYKEIESDDFSMQTPQIASVIESGVRAYINRKTVALKFSGINAILAPSHGLFDVRTLKKGGEILRVVGKDVTNNRISDGTGWVDITEESNPDLAWKLAINTQDPTQDIYKTEAWVNFTLKSEEIKKIKTKVKKEGRLLTKEESQKLDREWLTLRNNLQLELDRQDSEGNFIWKVEPAEVIMPFMFRDKFGLLEGMQPSDATLEFFEQQVGLKEFIDNLKEANYPKDIDQNTQAIELRQKALLKYQSFQKALDVIVGRIPSTGLQSMMGAKIIGFVESNKNSIWFPKELMMIQGADLDIDKAVVLSWEFDKDGILIQDSSPEGLKNKATQLLYDINMHPSNQIVADSPVNMDAGHEEKFRRTAKNKEPFFSTIRSLFGVYVSKVLASEGKAMVGIVMNLYKAYNLIYYTDMKNRRSSKDSLDSNHVSRNTVKAICFYNGTDYTVKTEIANIDPKKAEKQAWAFFSTLGNAATDNAKEMILGAIKANPQTGNIIGVFTSYGVEVEEMFDFLEEPIIQEVMMKIRHATDIGNTIQIPLTVEGAIKQVLTDHGTSFKDFTENIYGSLTDREAKFLDSLYTLDKSAVELQKLAKALGINRELPVTSFDRFAFKQSVENYINELLLNKEIKSVFNLTKFLNPNESEYAESMKTLYKEVQSSFNILKVIDETPDIKEYLKGMVYLDEVIEGLTTKYKVTESIVDKFKVAAPENQFKNITEDEYKGVVRFIEEYTVANYVQGSGKFNDLHIYSEGIKKDLDINNLEDIAKFQEMFPEFLKELLKSSNNPSFTNNKFFSALTPQVKATGNFLIIPNIQDMTKNEQYELQMALNKFNSDLNYYGTTIKNEDFKRFLFLNSLINSKGRVSTTSYFELMDHKYKNLYGYTAYLNANPNLINRILDIEVTKVDALAKTLSNLLPAGQDYFGNGTVYDEFEGREVKAERLTYSVNLEKEVLPPFVKHRFKNILYTYKLDSIVGRLGVEEKVYSIVKDIYTKVTLSVHKDLDQRSHITAGSIYKRINNGKKLRQIIMMKPGESVQLIIKTKYKLDRPINVDLQIGRYIYNPKTELLSHKC